MRHLNILIFSVITIAIAMWLTGCHSARQSAVATGNDSIKLSLDSRFDLLAGSYADWTDVNAPIKLRLQQPKEMSISGRLYMTRGQNVMLSLRFLGMEVMNLYVNSDSIYATDKIHKYYLAEDLKSLVAGFPMTINDVQDLLLGRVFLLQHGTLSPKMKRHVELSEINSYMAISPKKSFNGIEYAFGADADNRLKALTATRNGSDVLQCVYDKWVDSNAGKVACSNQVSLTLGETFLQATLESDYDAAKWDTPNTRSWKMPKGYKRVYGKALIEAFASK